MSHTPGPWNYEEPDVVGLPHLRAANGDAVATFLREPWNSSDIPLIAAAPELLEELREMLEYARILRSFYIDDEDLRGKGTMIEEDIERAEALLRRVKEEGA